MEINLLLFTSVIFHRKNATTFKRRCQYVFPYTV